MECISEKRRLDLFPNVLSKSGLPIEIGFLLVGPDSESDVAISYHIGRTDSNFLLLFRRL